MKPPGKTNIMRMQQTALAEMERIEITQRALVAEKLLAAPDAGAMARRDDFAGIVRLIDLIQTDAVMLDRLKAGMARAAIARSTEVNVDAEVEPE
ncbi:hypothetical protein EOW77_0003465 [Bradyrhizobium yuanmingense]|uniref:hypothetical protein n=1 Tax=Bradyrhizobium yuanmingense TaxID=108015 RepID=UPI000FE2A9C8|nr:hypothetical protein [Bradyrhizobium yuanmingense]TGN90904.1 hypothetical protein EOW77_0003465 [Bradyrhizobium yuanmingense]